MISSTTGNKFRVTIFGESHSEYIGAEISGVPSGIKLDNAFITSFLDRRRARSDGLTTQRTEDDVPEILSGIFDGVSDGNVIKAVFRNKNFDSSAYENTSFIPRPSHQDYPAFVKTGVIRPGGGHNSGRLTLPLCFAGAIALILLKEYGVMVCSHIYSAGSIKDVPYDPVSDEFPDVSRKAIGTISDEAGERIRSEIENARKKGDSLGGIIECAVTGLPTGLGEPMFEGLENSISKTVFGVPAVKGIEFGSGFDGTFLYGSEYNDQFTVKDGRIVTKTNNNGGILAGMSDGMPLVFRTAIKPTPSIALPQTSVDLNTMKETELKITGRHDPCIVIRALPCIEAAAAIALAEYFL